jgi:hypothetical protein
MKMTAKPTELDDDEITTAMEEFCEEHERQPYTPDEFIRWYKAQVKVSANLLAQHLEMMGIKVIRDKDPTARIVDKP